MPTFDVVSQVDLQEVRNAVDQAARETATRYDFKGTDTTVALGDEAITIESSTEERLAAAVDVLREKLVRRKVSLKAVSGGEPTQVGGGRVRALLTLNTGIDTESARQLNKLIKSMGLKVQSQINGDQLRISGKKRDDLQQVIAELRSLDFHLPLQYVNFRD